MSTNLPLRTVRIPALQRQCLFRRHQPARPLAACASRTFSSTAQNAHQKKAQSGLMQDMSQTRAAARAQTGPSPRVNVVKAQQDESGMAEDIGLLQNTIVRAPLKDLPSVFSPKFWGYFWTLFKAKGTALYTRSLYQSYMYKTGFFQRWRPVDLANHVQLIDKAQKLYEQLYTELAAGDISRVREHCLTPFAQKLQDRIAARDPLMEMTWRLKRYLSCRIVSHRASPLGEDHPDTAYRQIVVRLQSVQTLSITGGAGLSPSPSSPSLSQNPRPSRHGGLKWVPSSVREQALAPVQEEDEIYQDLEYVDSGVPKTVVEYLVLQRRIIAGRQEPWKVWGFAEESTPARIDEDEAYWRKALALQTAGGEQ